MAELPAPDYERGNVRLWCADSLRLLPLLPAGSVDAVVTDPPYGVEKAEWDKEFPTEWFSFAREIAETCYIMVGQSSVPLCIEMAGQDYRDVMAIWLANGMTLGPLGFGNWIPVVITQKIRRFLGGQNAFRVVVDPRENIDHPCPKPLAAMLHIIRNREHPSILDPFLGSGTTAVACIQTGRACLGIEIDPRYFTIACKRCDAAFEQMALYEPTPPAVRRELFPAEEPE